MFYRRIVIVATDQVFTTCPSVTFGNNAVPHHRALRSSGRESVNIRIVAITPMRKKLNTRGKTFSFIR